MRKGDAVQLRSALAAAVVCALLTVASLGDARRTGLRPVGAAQQTEPILARSISTLHKLGGADAVPTRIQDEGSAAANEAVVHTFEAVVHTFTVVFAEELEAARLRLGALTPR
jgi:hypothetical protein